MIKVAKPTRSDISAIEKILSFWTEQKEADKYIKRIENEIDGKTKFNLQFWTAKEKNKPLGIIGLCNPLPTVIPFAKTKKPGEIKILSVDNQSRKKGIGKKLVQFTEDEAQKQGCKELLVRSSRKYKNTAYGFYKKMGYSDLGVIKNTSGKPMQLFEKLLKSRQELPVLLAQG